MMWCGLFILYVGVSSIGGATPSINNNAVIIIGIKGDDYVTTTLNPRPNCDCRSLTYATSDVTDDQGASLVEPNCTGEVGGHRHGDGGR